MPEPIRDIKIIFGEGAEPPWEYLKIPVDLNLGAGGEFIYLCFTRDEKIEPNLPPITDIITVKGTNNPPQGYTKINKDLNQGIGAWPPPRTSMNPIYLCFERLWNKPPLLDILIQATKYEGQNTPSEYKKLPLDLNQGVHGNYIYIYAKYGEPLKENPWPDISGIDGNYINKMGGPLIGELGHLFEINSGQITFGTMAIHNLAIGRAAIIPTNMEGHFNSKITYGFTESERKEIDVKIKATLGFSYGVLEGKLEAAFHSNYVHSWETKIYQEQEISFDYPPMIGTINIYQLHSVAVIKRISNGKELSKINYPHNYFGYIQFDSNKKPVNVPKGPIFIKWQPREHLKIAKIDWKKWG